MVMMMLVVLMLIYMMIMMTRVMMLGTASKPLFSAPTPGDITMEKDLRPHGSPGLLPMLLI